MMRAGRRQKVALASLAVIVGAGVAQGDILTEEIFSLSVSSSLGTATKIVTLEDDGVLVFPDGTVIWNSQVGYDLVDPDNGNTIATLSNGSATIIDDPVLGLSFTLVGGAEDTNVEVTSALLGVGFGNAEGRASAGITLTDSDGDGASVSGDSVYAADYNGMVPDGTNFATLLGDLSAGNFGTATADDEFPAGDGNFSPIAGFVEDMSSQFAFTLSANDQVGVTSVYVITPAPAGAALLGFAGLAAFRRRR